MILLQTLEGAAELSQQYGHGSASPGAPGALPRGLLVHWVGASRRQGPAQGGCKPAAASQPACTAAAAAGRLPSQAPPCPRQGVELLAHGAEGKVERVKAEEALAGKTVGIYFSAHWWVGAGPRPRGKQAPRRRRTCVDATRRRCCGVVGLWGPLLRQRRCRSPRCYTGMQHAGRSPPPTRPAPLCRRRCGPCRAFTPTLAATYQEVRSRQQDFVVLFVSADRNPQQFEVRWGCVQAGESAGGAVPA